MTAKELIWNMEEARDRADQLSDRYAKEARNLRFSNDEDHQHLGAYCGRVSLELERIANMIHDSIRWASRSEEGVLDKLIEECIEKTLAGGAV